MDMKGQPWKPLAALAVFFVATSLVLLTLIVQGKIRRASGNASSSVSAAETSSTMRLVSRRLDGVLVPTGEEAFTPRAIMIDNQADARPFSGVASAQLVIEAPVEGGITRLLAFFDATNTVFEIGPVRSARPYFVDWALGWRALYAHVGGSPEALEKIRALGENFSDANEMFFGGSFWRSNLRRAPHSTYTNTEQMTQLMSARGFASSTAPIAWHFQDAVSSTERGGVARVSVPYGGSYSVMWKYDRERGVYTRSVSGRRALDRDGASLESENVVLMKTDAQVLDTVGRLRVRTIGSGDAIAYRDGNKYPLRWRRSAGEPIRFESQDGREFLFTRGRTWVEVTVDDQTFAGLEH